MKKFSLFILSILLIFTILPSASADAPVAGGRDPLIRVGLYYGSNALPSANLANQIGSGYQFGYFDSQKVFIPAGTTAQEKITVLKDKTMYVMNGSYYDTLPPTGATMLGAYHVDSGLSYASYEEAATAAANCTASGSATAFPAFINSEYRVRIGHYETLDEANSAAASSGLTGASGVGGSQTCYTVVITETGEFLYEFDCSTSAYMAIKPSGTDNTETWFKGYKYAGSFEYRRNSGNDITVINVITLSDYTKGVLPYEMNPKWSAEALKAQAVCAASYALSNLGKHSSSGFDMCTTTDCQVYRGRNAATANSDAASEAVRGIALYYSSNVADTVYHSSNGGSTESAVNVWEQNIPYLQAVPDNFEDLASANNGIWSFDYSGADITWILQNKGFSIGTIVDAYVDEYTPAGNVYRLTFVDESGKKLSFEKGKARTILNSDTLKKYTYSQRFTISGGIRFSVTSATAKVSAADGYAIGKGGVITKLTGRNDVYLMSADGLSALTRSKDSYIVSGRGWGHNVGMSQYGAKGMAEQGYTYDQILKYYFTNTEVQPIP